MVQGHIAVRMGETGGDDEPQQPDDEAYRTDSTSPHSSAKERTTRLSHVAPGGAVGMLLEI